MEADSFPRLLPAGDLDEAAGVDFALFEEVAVGGEGEAVALEDGLDFGGGDVPGDTAGLGEGFEAGAFAVDPGQDGFGLLDFAFELGGGFGAPVLPGVVAQLVAGAFGFPFEGVFDRLVVGDARVDEEGGADSLPLEEGEGVVDLGFHRVVELEGDGGVGAALEPGDAGFAESGGQQQRCPQQWGHVSLSLGHWGSLASALIASG